MKLLGTALPYKVVIHDYETKALIIKVLPEEQGKAICTDIKADKKTVDIDGTLFKTYDIKKCGPVDANDHVLKYIETLKPENQKLVRDRIITIAKYGLTPLRNMNDVNSFLNYYYAEAHS